MNNIKRRIAVSMLLIFVLVCGLLSACGSGGSGKDNKTPDATDSAQIETTASAEEPGADQSEQASSETHKIGVLVYDIADEEVMAFRHYLEGYIAQVFPDVQFLYSQSIMSPEAELEFIQSAADAGAEGIMSFLSYDLEAEVSLCEKNEIYYLMASGSVAKDQFDAAADNPWFLGIVGPGEDIEYQAGYDLGKYMAEKDNGNDYFLLSGGASMGNEMHLSRTKGILDAIQDVYGAAFEQDPESLAGTQEPCHIKAGDASVCVCPGYISVDEFRETAEKEFAEDGFDVVLSVIPVTPMESTIKGCDVAAIDCYTESNLRLFSNGQLSYLTGKFGSLIGPSFAAMYNAVTGYADDFQENGRAFEVTQGFWVSDSSDDYVEKYTYASSLELNAYNYEDLQSVCKVYNPNATLEDLEKLAESCSFEDVQARRQ